MIIPESCEQFGIFRRFPSDDKDANQVENAEFGRPGAKTKYVKPP